MKHRATDNPRIAPRSDGQDALVRRARLHASVSSDALRRQGRREVGPAPRDLQPSSNGDPAVGARTAAARREQTAYERFVKPVVDRVIAATLLALLTPVLITIALVLWLTLGSPILFRQARIGRGGRPFNMYKFRTMHPDRRQRSERFDGPDRRKVHKTPDDPRHTRTGRILRQTSLDEFPQLFNVLKGEMSLVGPRPELLPIVERYEPWQHARHTVKPGLTGLWQVSERGNGLMHEHVSIDLEYVQRISFKTDCAVLLRTIPAMLKRDTA